MSKQGTHIERILRRGLLRFDRSRRNHAMRTTIKDRLQEIRRVGAAEVREDRRHGAGGH